MDHAEVPGLNRARTADLPSQVSRTAHENMNREQRLSRWIDLYSDTILKTCFLYLSDRQQAEDVLQDTWIKAWKHMEDIDRKGITNEKAWLLRIAINTCKDYRRTAWFRHVDTRKAIEDLPARLVSSEPEDRTLTLIVMDLPERYKQIILLHYFQGLTLQETADVLGQSASTAHRRLKKAEALLKDALERGEAHE